MHLVKVPRLLEHSINTPASAPTGSAVSERGLGYSFRSGLGLGESHVCWAMPQAFPICPFGGQGTVEADSSQRHSQRSGPQPEQVVGRLSLWGRW